MGGRRVSEYQRPHGMDYKRGIEKGGKKTQKEWSRQVSLSPFVSDGLGEVSV